VGPHHRVTGARQRRYGQSTGKNAAGHPVTGRQEPDTANLATSEQPQRKWLKQGGSGELQVHENRCTVD